MTTETDISMEERREYVTRGGAVYRIDRPIKLHITDTGSHRVVDAEGMVHRPPKFEGNEYAVRWKPMAGQPDFVA